MIKSEMYLFIRNAIHQQPDLTNRDMLRLLREAYVREPILAEGTFKRWCTRARKETGTRFPLTRRLTPQKRASHSKMSLLAMATRALHNVIPQDVPFVTVYQDGRVYIGGKGFVDLA